MKGLVTSQSSKKNTTSSQANDKWTCEINPSRCQFGWLMVSAIQNFNQDSEITSVRNWDL